MITAEDLSKYLDTQSDFDLELFVYRNLAERGIEAMHGGTYRDPVTDKYRQFDIRAWMKCHATCGLSMAIECKSLSEDYPLVVCRVPRQPEESFHEVLRSYGRVAVGEIFVESLRIDNGMRLYAHDQLVGKKTVQVRKEANGRGFKSGDSEAYEKWSQALASASDLVQEARGSNGRHREEQFHTIVLPILVVSDRTLWAADYTGDGRRVGAPAPVNEATLFVDREYGYVGGVRPYRISHLQIYTRSGLEGFLGDIGRPDSQLRERMFRTALRHN